MTPVARTVGASRIIPAAGIVHPVGNPDAAPEEEKKLRREIVSRALRALQTQVSESTLFAAE